MNRITSLILISALFLLVAAESNAQRPAGRQAEYVPFQQRISHLENSFHDSRGTRRTNVSVSLAEAHFHAAELYNLIWRQSVAINEIYYSILDENGYESPHQALFYRAIGYFETGETEKSAYLLAKLLNSKEPNARAMQSAAHAWLGGVFYAENRVQSAVRQWGNLAESYHRDCSVLAYVQGRVNYKTDDLTDRCINIYIGSGYNDDVINVIQSLIATGSVEGLSVFVREAESNNSYSEYGEGDGIFRMYDPSRIVTLAHAHYFLSAYYAGESAMRNEKDYYESVYFFRTGQYEKVIGLQSDRMDTRVMPYLAASYYMTGDVDAAEELFKRVENSGDGNVREKMAVMYAELNIPGKELNAINLIRRAPESGRRGERQDAFQSRQISLGKVYFYLREYESAVETLSGVFRPERRRDMRANPPDLVVLYGSSIVLSKSFINISEAIDMFSTLARSYPVASALVETTSMIDVVTNIGREGRVIYRR